MTSWTQEAIPLENEIFRPNYFIDGQNIVINIIIIIIIVVVVIAVVVVVVVIIVVIIVPVRVFFLVNIFI